MKILCLGIGGNDGSKNTVVHSQDSSSRLVCARCNAEFKNSGETGRMMGNDLDWDEIMRLQMSLFCCQNISSFFSLLVVWLCRVYGLWLFTKTERY